jgi:hypothetical protein
MTARTLFLAEMLLAALPAATCRLVAQTNVPQQYTLVSGSQLIDDCPMCGRPTILAPMAGTFELRLLDQNPLFARFQMLNIFFHAGTNSQPEYKVTGGGTYQVGGEVALAQNLYLDVSINNGSVTTDALCANTNTEVNVPWPKLQLSVDQTNGTPGQVYHLDLIAIPVPAMSPASVDYKSGNVRLNWEANGGEFQVERAPEIGGPYTALAPASTNSSYTDVGVLTNQPRAFYRLRQF